MAAAYGYLNAKHHIHKDLEYLYYLQRGERYQQKLKQQGKINIWATFVANATRFADRDCIWYSGSSNTPPTVTVYSWKQAHEQACRYASWFLSQGVRRGDCVGFFLQNSPDFVLAWMGLLAIGCYPATINYNLVGGALVHCVKIAECKLLLVDEDFQDRVLEVAELRDTGVATQVMDRDFRDLISKLPPLPPPEELTSDVHEKTRVALRYTRHAFRHVVDKYSS